MQKKSIYYLLAVIVIAIAALWFFLGKKPVQKSGNQPKARPVINVDAYVVKPSLLINEISVSGSILAFDAVDLKNEVSGRITELNLPEGEKTTKGTLLVKLFDDDIVANLHKIEAQQAIQEKILLRQAELLKVNGISQNEYDQTNLQVSSLKADAEYQRALIRKTEVRAPFDGIIGLRYVSVGAQVASGTLLATLRTNDKLKLDFNVPEKYGSMVKPGMNVRFTIDNPAVTYQATVLATEMGIDNQTRNLKIRALIEKPGDLLIPGSYANVSLQLGQNPLAVMIPSQCIIPGEQSKMVIKAQNGKAHFVVVKTGARETSTIEVSEGLQPGDTVITSGIMFLKEGAKLVYSSVKTGSL